MSQRHPMSQYVAETKLQGITWQWRGPNLHADYSPTNRSNLGLFYSCKNTHGRYGTYLHLDDGSCVAIPESVTSQSNHPLFFSDSSMSNIRREHQHHMAAIWLSFSTTNLCPKRRKRSDSRQSLLVGGSVPICDCLWAFFFFSFL